MPFLSIIIPVFNAEHYLHACLGSILTQSFQDFEVLLIDDGSTDRSLEICRDYTQKDSRVLVFHQGNAGPSEARNLGMDNAQGRYITFVDADDELMPETLNLNIDYLLKHPDVQLLQFPMMACLPDGQRKLKFNQERTINGRESINSLWCVGNDVINGFFWGKIYNRELLDGLRLPVGMRNSEDAWLMCEVLSRCNCVFLSNLGAYQYNLHNDSLSYAVGQEQVNAHTTNNMSVLLKKLHNAFELRLSYEVKTRIFSFTLTSLLDAVIHHGYPDVLARHIVEKLDAFRLEKWYVLSNSAPIRARIKVLAAKMLGVSTYMRIMRIVSH